MAQFPVFVPITSSNKVKVVFKNELSKITTFGAKIALNSTVV
jgi:hypothetical protein